MRTVGIMLLLTLILQGCGRKGPLFLPPAEPAAQSSAATAQQPVSTESKKAP